MRLLALFLVLLLMMGCSTKTPQPTQGSRASEQDKVSEKDAMKPSSPEERRRAYQSLREKLAGRSLPEQIAAVRALDRGRVNSMQEAEACFGEPRTTSTVHQPDGTQKPGAPVEPCPFVYLVADIEAVEEQLGRDVLLPTDRSLTFYDAQRIVFNPRYGDDPGRLQQAIITWYRAGDHPSVSTVSIGYASSASTFLAGLGDDAIRLEDDTKASFRVTTIYEDGAPFPYPWQETEAYMAFAKGKFFYQITGSNLKREEIVALANSMR